MRINGPVGKETIPVILHILGRKAIRLEREPHEFRRDVVDDAALLDSGGVHQANQDIRITRELLDLREISPLLHRRQDRRMHLLERGDVDVDINDAVTESRVIHNANV